MSRTGVKLLLAATAVGLWDCGVSDPSATSMPTIDALSPESAPAGCADIHLAITGANFSDALHSRSQVVWSTETDTIPLATTYESGTRLTAVVPAALLGTPAEVRVYVQDIDPQDHLRPRARSNARAFSVALASAAITTISPAIEPVGSSAVTISITGSGFLEAAHYRSEAVWVANGEPTVLPTTFVNSTRLTASIPAALLSVAMTALVHVEVGDPLDDPRLRVSNPYPFRVDDAHSDPWILGMSPSSTAAGSPDLTLEITGLHFAPPGQTSSRAMWVVRGQPTPLATTFVDSTQLIATVPASLLRTPDTALVWLETRGRTDELATTSNWMAFTVIASTPQGGDVAEIVLSHPPGTIGIGEQALLHAWANSATVGRITLASPIEWTSEDPSIARVSSTENDGYPGVDFWATLRGVHVGTVLVTAADGGKTAEFMLEVGEPAATMSLSPTMATISAAQCQAVQLRVTLRDADGHDLTGRQLTWSSSSPSAYVDETGLVFATDSGRATITASTGLISAGVAITVVGHQPGFPRRFGCDG